MGVLRYAASGVLRNRRRTFSSILGVLLVVTFVAGTFIAIDSSTRSALDRLLAGIQGDFGYSAVAGSSTNATALRDALDAVSGVTDASVYSSWGFLINSTSPTDFQFGAQIFGIVPGHLPAFFEGIVVSGSLALANGTAALSLDLATQLGVGLGDNVQLVNQVWFPDHVENHTANLTVAATFTIPPPPGYYGRPGYYYSSSLLLNIEHAPWVLQELGVSEPYPSVQGEVWIDRGRFVNPYDVAATRFQLQRLQRQLEAALVSAGATSQYVYENITSQIQLFADQMTFQRVMYLLLSTPVLLLGLYLGAVGVDLGHAERRRELAVLKTRGASRRQVIGLLILESVIGGLLAAVVGIVVGVALSRLLLNVVNPYAVGFAPRFEEVFLSADTVVTVVLLSILFMALVSYRSAKRTAGLPVAETLRYYAPGETAIHYSPFVDIAIVAYAVVAYVGTVLLQGGGGSFFSFLFGGILLASLPVVSILLIIAVTRLATRSTGRVYAWASRIFRPFARNLETIINRNLSRNPRRASSVAIIVALGLGFGIFTVSTLGSQQAYQERFLRASIGADLSVSPPLIPAAGFEQNLSAIPSVRAVSRLTQLSSVSPGIFAGGGFWPVYAFDPSSYFDVSRPESLFLEPSTLAHASAVLSTRNQVLITKAFADQAALQVGDLVPLVGNYYNYTNQTSYSITVRTTVGGIVRLLPGAGFGGYSVQASVYLSHATAEPFAAAASSQGPFSSYGTDVYLVSLQPGADWRAVRSAAYDLGSAGIQSYQEQLEALQSNPFAGSLLGFIRMEVAFIVVILTAGLALIIYAASLERDVEFAAMLARGASGWQTAGLLVGEGFVVMLIGLVVGTGVGIATSFFFVRFVFFGSLFGPEPAIPFLFVFPLDGFLLLAIAAAAMLLACLAVSWKTARMNVAKVLKMRGG